MLQADFDGPGIAALAALKIYFDVVDEGLGQPPTTLAEVFGRAAGDVTGTDDLGHFCATTTDVNRLLSQSNRRYAALAELEGEPARLATTGSPRDRRLALELRDALVTRLRVE